MIIPAPLTINDRIRMVSPAGCVDAALIDGAEKTLSAWGWQIERGASATAVHGRFAGTEEERLNDLQLAFDDPSCKAIFCTRGGYGTVHLIEKLDLSGFRQHPKWLVGYSDITLLHALLQVNGFASIHGGMAKHLAQGDNPNEIVPGGKPLERLYDLLTGKRPEIILPSHPLNRPGKSKGMLRGGNLSIVYSMRGTPLDFIPQGSILFLEDIGEKPYSVDRMMYNLKLGGVLERIAGLVVGQFSDYEEDPLMLKSVYERIADVVSGYDYPVCFDFPVGHTERNLPLISGATVSLNVQESGVALL